MNRRTSSPLAPFNLSGMNLKSTQPKAVAPPADTAFDLGSSLKAIGLPEDMFGQSKSLGGNEDWTGQGLDRQIRLLGNSISEQQKSLAQQVDPFAEAKLQMDGKRAQTDTELAALALNPPVKQPDYQYTPDTPYPVREGLPIPQRPEAQVNPAASILAGIGGFIAPQGAAHFGASAIHGAVQRANQTYADSLRTRDMQLQDLDRRHSDEVQARNEAIRFAEDNLDRKTRAEFLDAVGKRDYGLAISKLSGQRASDQVVSNGYSDLTGAARAQAEAIANLQSLQQNKIDLEGKQVAIAKGAQESQKLKISLLEQIAKIQDIQARTAEQKQKDAETARHNQTTEKSTAAGHGFNVVVGPDGTQTLVPMSQDQLPADKQAKINIDQQNAQTSTRNADTNAANSKSLQAYREAQIKKILSGEAVDSSKLTPNQKLAFQAFAGAQKVYTQAHEQTAMYVNKNKDNPDYGNTPAYKALDAAERNAALQYQLAHKAAVESTGRAYLGKIKGYDKPNTAATGPTKISTDDEFKKLPSGTIFIGPDGQTRRKP